MAINKLLLLSKNDIPFHKAQLVIHQPTIKEISMIGQKEFYAACQLILFDKQNLKEQDKVVLINQSNFNIIMSIVNAKNNITFNQNKVYLEFLLALLFPYYRVMFTPKEIVLLNDEHPEDIHKINDNNFEDFKSIVLSMFNLDGGMSGNKYNPKGVRAQQIVKKLEQRKKKLSARRAGESDIEILSKYISILSVGLQKDMNSLLDYTIPQITEQFNRFQRKQAYDIYIQAKLAGAEGLEETKNWMDDSANNQQQIKSIRNNRIQYS